MDKKPLAVILGAGPVGTAVGMQFLERGVPVRFVTRSGRPVAVPGAETVAADARDGAALTKAADGASILVHAVGVPYQDWSRDLPPLQEAVLVAAERTGAVAVFVENLYSYAAGSLPLTEDTPENPPTRKGALRKALSDQWLEAHRAGRIRGVAVRASDYWGPGATRSGNSHLGSRFFPGFEAGKAVAFLGDPDASHSYTYLPDFARALADVALDPGAWGQTWISPSLAPTTARTAAERFAQVAGKTVKVGRLPSGMVRLLGVFDPLIREVVEMLYQFERPFTVDARRFEARFGWKATDLDTAVRQTWAAHRSQTVLPPTTVRLT
jgi:nucleoside-diphosphate-sugar epimerase